MSKRKNSYSNLNKHKRVGNKIKSPWSAIGNLETVSWVNNAVPNILWACILSSNMKREECLVLFRKIITNIKDNIKNYENVCVTHDYLSLLTENDFEIFLQPILENIEAKKLLSCILSLESLPDINLWKKYLPQAELDNSIQTLAKSVAVCFDHQSQEATDVRWLILMNRIIGGKITFPDTPEMKEMLEEFRLYPSKGDMRKVRPSIRSLEMGLRNFRNDDSEQIRNKLPDLHSKKFWDEVFSKSKCIIPSDRKSPKKADSTIQKELISVYESVANHFDKTLISTTIDARHDSSFGLVLYTLTLSINCIMDYGHNLAEGRTILRSAVEALIMLRYLTKKDDSTIWMQYRNYGLGQAKLAFLKNLNKEDLPDFLDMERLEALGNEDIWLEFQDINLGSWSNYNLRKMSEDTGLKDLYDKYYDWTSGYAHSHWACVRDTVFVPCINPLHRYHRIPAPPRLDLPSVIVDICKIINQMLDDLNILYPSLKIRLKEYKNPK